MNEIIYELKIKVVSLKPFFSDTTLRRWMVVVVVVATSLPLKNAKQLIKSRSNLMSDADKTDMVPVEKIVMASNPSN